MRTSTFETGYGVSAPQTEIRDKALEEGFDVVGFADANITDTSGERLAKFIEHSSKFEPGRRNSGGTRV